MKFYTILISIYAGSPLRNGYRLARVGVVVVWCGVVWCGVVWCGVVVVCLFVVFVVSC